MGIQFGGSAADSVVIRNLLNPPTNGSDFRFSGTAADQSLLSDISNRRSWTSPLKGFDNTTTYDSFVARNFPAQIAEDSLKESLPEDVEVLEGVAEAGEAAESEAGPLGLAMMVGQQIGGALSSGFESSDDARIAQVNQQNSNVHGINAGLNSSLVSQNLQSLAFNDKTMSNLGAVLMGPIGALIGHAISSSSASGTTANLNNVSSFSGMVSGTNSSVSESHSTQAIDTGSELITQN